MNNNFSFAVSVSPTSFGAIAQGDWKETACLMSLSGYNGIELAIKNPDLIDIEEMKKVLNEYNLKLVAQGTGQAFVDEKLSFTDNDFETRKKAVERIKKHINFACNFNSIVIIGLIRGFLTKDPEIRNQRMIYFKETIKEIDEYALMKNIFIAIEPINRYECDFFNRAEEVISFIEKENLKNIGLLLDTFHMNIEEKNFDDTIINSKKHLKHIHIADSNRKFPGEGHINFIEIKNTIKEIGYTGFLSGEMLPLPDLQTAIKNYIKNIKEVVNE